MHRAEVLRGIVFCWRNIADETRIVEELGQVRGVLAENWRLLVKAVECEGEVDLQGEVQGLVEFDERLARLFEVQS